MTERDDLERQAVQCRRFARSTTDKPAADALSNLADELEARIRDMDADDASRAAAKRSG